MIWLGRSITVQILGRLLQGSAVAMVWITGLAMIADAVGPDDIEKYVGYVSIAMMLGTLVAPLIGGIVSAKVEYNMVFIITLAIIALDALLRLLTIEPKVALKWTETLEIADPASSKHEHRRSTTIRKSSLEMTVNLEEHTATTTQEQKPKTVAVLALPDSESDLPIQDIERAMTNSHGEIQKTRLPAVLTLLTSRRLLCTLLGSVIEGTIFSGLEAVLPLQTPAAFGWDSIGGGLIFLPLTIAAFLGPVVGWVCDRHGPRWPTFLGFFMLCPLLTLMRFVSEDHNSMDHKVLLCALLTLIGCCFTATLDPLMAEIAYVVGKRARSNPSRHGDPMKAYAQGFSLFNMVFSIGKVIGPLIAGFIRDSAGGGTMSWVMRMMAGITSIPTLFLCGG